MLDILTVTVFIAFALPAVIAVFGAAIALHNEARNEIHDFDGVCTPSRHASITASTPQTQRRMVEPISPPYTFDTRPRLMPATTHVSITPAPAPKRTRRPAPVVVPMAAPVPAPIAVPDWPTRQTVEPKWCR
jgi:hypothetical protein